MLLRPPRDGAGRDKPRDRTGQDVAVLSDVAVTVALLLAIVITNTHHDVRRVLDTTLSPSAASMSQALDEASARLSNELPPRLQVESTSSVAVHERNVLWSDGCGA